MNYVTYDQDGCLTGSYNQELRPDHIDSYIELLEPLEQHWTAYKANDERTGLELLPAPDPTEPPAPPVPASVTRRQARQALLLAGLLDDVQPAIDAIEDETARRLAQIEWEDSLEFMRHRPLVVSIGAALGLDEAGLDDLFIQAAGL